MIFEHGVLKHKVVNITKLSPLRATCQEAIYATSQKDTPDILDERAGCTLPSTNRMYLYMITCMKERMCLDDAVSLKLQRVLICILLYDLL